MRKITAVTFDLWDTLIQEHPGGSDRLAKLRIEKIGSLLSSRGIIHSKDEIGSAYKKTGDFLELTWSKRRDMPVHDQVLFMLSSIDDKLACKLSRQDLAAVEKIYAECILDNPPRMLPGAKEALRSVKENGYRTGLISNTGRTPGSALRLVMDNMGIVGFFDTMTFSNEILVRKPAEGAFRVTLDRLRVLPRAAVHIGDDCDGDILGAKKVGMHAIQIVPPGARRSSEADSCVDSLDSVIQSIARL
jgi:putative hydrolase of the HAD superfamily